MTDFEVAYSGCIELLTLKFARCVIEQKRPDSLLPVTSRALAYALRAKAGGKRPECLPMGVYIGVGE
ncbi:MAG: hypothetical protein ACUVRS_00945 [Armatimonadota bacterium]